MSYHYNGNCNAQSNLNGGYPMRGGQRNGLAPATHGHSVQHPGPQVLHQHLPNLHQRPQSPPQQASAPLQPLPPARAPPPPPIHFVLDRQYTLCHAPLPPAPPAPQYVPSPPVRVPQYRPARDGAHYTPARNVPHLTTARDGPHYAQTPSNGARYVPPALRNDPQYTPAPHTPYAPVAAPALVPFRCAHPRCGGRVVMVASAREHMWAAHRVRV